MNPTSPALGALLIACSGERRANLREFWSVAAGVAMFALVASMIPEVLAGRTPECALFRILPGIELAFRVDAFGLLFASGASLLMLLFLMSLTGIPGGAVSPAGEPLRSQYFLDRRQRSRQRLQALRRIGQAVDDAGLYVRVLAPGQE